MSEQKIFQESKWFLYLTSILSGIGIGIVLTILFCYFFGYSEAIQLVGNNNFSINTLCIMATVIVVVVIISITISAMPGFILYTFDGILIVVFLLFVLKYNTSLMISFAIYFTLIIAINSYFILSARERTNRNYWTIVFIVITLSSILYICPFVYESQAKHNIAQAEFLLSGAERGQVKVSSVAEANWLLKHIYYQEPEIGQNSFPKRIRGDYSYGEWKYYVILPKTEHPVHLFSGHIDKEVIIKY